MLNSELLAEYADEFFGYGNWRAKVWFIGVEEGGGRSETEVQQRLNVWKESSKLDLQDLPTFCPASGIREWHGTGARLQETWAQLIRILLVARQMPDTEDALLDYQTKRLGRLGDETCLIELLPLPSPRMKQWNYASWSNLYWLKDRESYYAHLLASRAFDLARKIESNKPAAVVFYGSSLHRTWGRMAGVEWTQAIPNKLMECTKGGTAFFVTKHPVDPKLHDNRNDYFREIGKYLSREHGSRFR
jgi:hypothetical protein